MRASPPTIDDYTVDPSTPARRRLFSGARERPPRQGVAGPGERLPAGSDVHVDVPEVHERRRRGEGQPEPHRGPAGK